MSASSTDRIAGQLDHIFESLHAIDLMYDAYARRIGMSSSAFIVLDYISDHDGATQRTVCEYAMLPRQTVHNIVATLVEQGVLRREDDPDDRRVKTLWLTDEGRALRERVIAPVRRAERNAMAALESTEREAMLQALDRFRDVLGRDLGATP